MQGPCTYTIIEHPSDLGIEARGRTMAEAFEEAARGMLSVLAECETVRPAFTRSVSITASDAEQLLVKWLSEVLYLYDGEHFLAGTLAIDAISETSLTATLTGEAFDAARHAPRLDVKAVTYHQLVVDRDHAMVRVFLDV